MSRRTFLSQNPNRPRLVAGLLVVAALGAALLVIAIASHDPQPRPADGDASASATSSLPATQPEEGVVLPAGTGQVAGYPVGFPHTDLGAVAAQAALNQAQIGFDYDQAATVIDVYAAPQDRGVLESRAREAVSYRRTKLAVPLNGAAPAPAAFALTPYAFQLQQLDADCYAVTVLNLASTTDTTGEVRNIYYSGTQIVRWSDRDWKVVAGTPAEQQQVIDQQQPPAVGPNDPQFRQAGWIKIKAAGEAR